MNAAAARKERVSRALLWVGLSAGAVAWTLHELVLYPISSQACFPGGGAPALPVDLAVGLGTLVAAGIAAAGLVFARRAGRRAPGRDSRAGGGRGGAGPDPAAQRERFMARAGVALSALFLYAILLAGLPTLFLDPCP